MKRFLRWFAWVYALALLLYGVKASAGQTLAAAAPLTVRTGEAFTVSLDFAGDMGAVAAQARVSWPANGATFTGFSETGTAFVGPSGTWVQPCPDNQPGLQTWAVFSLGNWAGAPQGHMGRLSFIAGDPGPLTFDVKGGCPHPDDCPEFGGTNGTVVPCDGASGVTVQVLPVEGNPDDAFKAGCIVAGGSTGVLPIYYSGVDAISAAVFTIEYDGGQSRYAAIEPGADATGWVVRAVNDNEHAPPCAATAPFRLLTVVMTAPPDCSKDLSSGELARVTFVGSGGGQQIMHLPSGYCGGASWSQAATCDLQTLFPGVVDGCIVWPDPSPVADLITARVGTASAPAGTIVSLPIDVGVAAGQQVMAVQAALEYDCHRLQFVGVNVPVGTATVDQAPAFGPACDGTSRVVVVRAFNGLAPLYTGGPQTAFMVDFLILADGPTPVRMTCDCAAPGGGLRWYVLTENPVGEYCADGVLVTDGGINLEPIVAVQRRTWSQMKGLYR